MNQEWKIKKVRETAAMPVRATEGSAGLDLSACLPEPLVRGAVRLLAGALCRSKSLVGGLQFRFIGALGLCKQLVRLLIGGLIASEGLLIFPGKLGGLPLQLPAVGDLGAVQPVIGHILQIFGLILFEAQDGCRAHGGCPLPEGLFCMGDGL